MRLENGGSLDLWTKMQMTTPKEIIPSPSATSMGPYTRLFVQVPGSSLGEEVMLTRKSLKDHKEKKELKTQKWKETLGHNAKKVEILKSPAKQYPLVINQPLIGRMWGSH